MDSSFRITTERTYDTNRRNQTPPNRLDDEPFIRQLVARQLRMAPDAIDSYHIRKRSIDARGTSPVFRLQIEVYAGETYTPEPALLAQLQDVSDKPPVIIVGAGPAGMFAALELIELGLKPIVLERGKDVRTRRRDLRAIQQFGQVDPHSNYCFGEGGAGTYSDGKLYTRSHKRGNIEKALRLFVEHGAHPDILIDAHPHIGSNKLPNIVANIRETIRHYGGAFLFEHHVTDFIIEEQAIQGVVVNGTEEFRAQAVLLATGHSARDIFYLLHQKGVHIEAKPFALGVRIEHPQPLIDQIQYGSPTRDKNLPASSYRLACQVDGRGVFSFCMCPGGLVVPAATAPGEIVVNGMSMSRRDSPYANSGTVVAVDLEDLLPYRQHGVFAGLAFQQAVEQTMYQHGDGSQRAPALRLPDFVQGKISTDLPGSSYIPGLYAAPLHTLLPDGIYTRLQQGVKDFGRKMKGYYTAEANVIGTESRTSSPIKIPRHPVTLMHEQISGLFPCGEGAGYAGGIISAAMDGQNVARAIVKFYR
ncbi:MAG: FAD-binding protein [Saprospiraceae bacterium]